MSPRLPRLMGHRGAAGVAPENTLASIRAAWDEGVSWIEVDVMLTGDGRPVMFHDDSLRRTTGVDGHMAETPYDRLATLDAGSWFGAAFAGQTVPTLDAAMALALELGLSVNIEIKPTPGRDVETVEAALGALSEIWPSDRPPPLISSFSIMSLAAARVVRPDWPRGLLVRGLPNGWRRQVEALGCVSVHLGNKLVNRFAVRRVKEAGYLVAVYTVNNARRARRFLSWGVDCVSTDYPGQLAAALTD